MSKPKEKRMMVDDDHLAKFKPKMDWEKFDKKLSLKIKNVFHNMFRCSGYDEKQFNEKIEYIKQFITDNRLKLIDDLVDEIFVAKDGVLGLRDIFIKPTEIRKIRNKLKQELKN